MQQAPIVEEFIQLVQVDSPSRKERKMVDLLTQKLTALGCTVWEDDAGKQIPEGTAGNLHAYLEGDLPGAVLFVAHMDRVQNGENVHPQVLKDKVVSDGSTVLAADDLAGVCAILDGLRRIQENPRPHPRIEILLTVCEEIGLQGTRYVDVSKFQAKIGYVLDSPGTIGRVLDSAMGKAELFLDVTGKAAHSAYPELGVSATRTAVLILSQLGDGRIDEDTVANWSYFEAPCPCNTIPGQAKAQAFLLSRNSQSIQGYIDQFENVSNLVAEKMGATVNARSILHYPPFLVEKNAPSIRRVCAALTQLGIEPRVEHGAGGCDANRLNDLGIECVALSTGYSKNHTVHEEVLIQDLIQSGKMVELLMTNPVE